MRITQTLGKWGNGTGLRLPKKVLEKANIQPNQELEVTIEGRSIVLTPVDATEIQMRQLAVDEEARGRGVGRMMVKYAEDLARELGFRRMVLHARETAVPFYELLRYTRVGDRFTEVTIPHWEMVKVL